MALRRMTIGMAVVLCILAGSELNAQTAEPSGATEAATATESMAPSAAESAVPSAEASALMALSPADRAARYADLKGRTLQTFNNADLGDYLQLRSGGCGHDERETKPATEIVHYAMKTVGQDYRLEAGRFDYQDSSCIVFLERCIAMSLSPDWRTYRQLSDRLRYKDGRVSTENKNYFTTADWEKNNSWLLRDASGDLNAPVTIVQERVNRRDCFKQAIHWNDEDLQLSQVGIQFGAYTSERNAQARINELRGKSIEAEMNQVLRGGKQLWIVQSRYLSAQAASSDLLRVRAIDRDARLTSAVSQAKKVSWMASLPEEETIEYSCIRTLHVRKTLDQLQSGDIVLILVPAKSDKSKVCCDHVGMIVRNELGHVYLLHSAPPTVRQEPIMQFLKRCDWVIGLRILRIKENARELASAEIVKMRASMPDKITERTPAQEDARVATARDARKGATESNTK